MTSDTSETKPSRRWRFLKRALIALLAIAAICVAIAWRDTMATPIVQRTNVMVDNFSEGSTPLRLALISDIHVAGPDMPPERLAEIVKQINALEPDIVLIAGDFTSDKRTATHIYSVADAIAPLGKLTPTIGTVAVPGNHDHWRDLPATNRALAEAGITVLANEAIQLGPLAIGGLDDDYTGRADIAKTAAALGKLIGPQIMLSHSPDPFPDLPGSVALMLAGHTHCGQLRYPWGGSPATLSKYGERYACGRVDEGGQTIITGAGLGTSLLPFRFFSKPEIWLIEIRPKPSPFEATGYPAEVGGVPPQRGL